MPVTRLGEFVIRLVWRDWRMWIVRTITGERGLRRDWENISSGLRRVRTLRFGILRFLTRFHTDRGVGRSHASRRAAHVLLVVNTTVER